MSQFLHQLRSEIESRNQAEKRRSNKRRQHDKRRGPYDRRSQEAFAKYIIVDLYARAVKGESADSVIKWAESELKNIYG